MNLRSKFILALISMVIFMSVVFTAISVLSQLALLRNAESYMWQSFSDNFVRFLSVYYEDHQSWAGVHNYVMKVTDMPEQEFDGHDRDFQPYLVFDQEDKVIVDPIDKSLGKSLAVLPPDYKIAEQWREIQVNGRTVGHYWQNQISLTTGHKLLRILGESIVRATLIGLLATSLLSLLLGLLLTRQLTKPLGRLMEAVRKVGKGDLSSRVEVKGKGDIAKLARDFNRMTEQLTRNEEVRRNMVADIAHELRTPLAVILGKLESIQEGVLPSTPETILPIQDETLRLIRLVRDLQQLSLAEAGKLPLSLRKVNLRQVVDRIIDQFTVEFEERGLQVEVVGDVPEILGDLDRMTQVFVNLIGNALLHTPPGGLLRIRLEEAEVAADEELRKEEPARGVRGLFRRGGEKMESSMRGDGKKTGKISANSWVQVTVEDSGEGIPEEELEHIFDRFYRVDKARERESGGTGLGLAIVREFVHSHGGFLQVESEIGKGSRFRVFLAVEPNPERKGM